MTFEDMNKKLCEAVEMWVKEKLKPYIDDNKTDCDKDGRYVGENIGKHSTYLSCPFYMGVTEDYALRTKSRRVMIIGQEARHYGIWKDNRTDFGYQPNESQEWAIDYLLCQIKTPNINSRFKINYNKSRFWQAVRELYNNDINVCWNNLDKVYYSRGNSDYKGTLTYKAEEYLSAPFCVDADKKSLLQREIEIAKPDALLFITGPSYYISMAVVFGLSPQKLKGRLDINNKIVDITSDLGIDIPAYWTYHPANRYVKSVKEFLAKYNV